ncbi:hypothetical protein NIES2119_30590 [[Phormidium ambiguum] IAM M-71]|uniref:Histidine kinase n=1 Tax=[Phormidium ambiguum] IAM M-71 TaxID=454136 RepID=A0A1U7I3H6_9CYAN|nr:hypothetical protein [Phormidium ambiguum]OKH30674.1 hypothetical protein NIES2119_30590 [Phormidium ambiguum IAM M-71]
MKSLLYWPASYSKLQQALQWWQSKQSMQLSYESEKIRDSLLQESFTLRRSLEISLLKEDANLTKVNHDLLNQMNKFYHYLQQLSDRLSPAYIEDSLPLAISYLIETWKTDNPQIKIKLNSPVVWQQDSLERNLLILNTLEELLNTITISDSITEVSIVIDLKRQGNLCELNLQISFSDTLTLVSYWNKKDLEYLSQTFEFLTGGQCIRWKEELMVNWCFQWVRQSDSITN